MTTEVELLKEALREKTRECKVLALLVERLRLAQLKLGITTLQEARRVRMQ